MKAIPKVTSERDDRKKYFFFRYLDRKEMNLSKMHGN